ncbi:integrase family protein [Desulfovibrio sp. X2]|uniref:tyrosine-type recombinase/integrase n=1 Tax=Desulfovibrio sp. X2 TaxID=941449 RepID=UPI000358DD50|nr:site-specific integrase [Desulfovibrio sp. X2]EPR42684.1 integrase family protein [Desulfovibrio sp. X2]
MSIEHRPDRKSPWRVVWRNPITGKREHKAFGEKAEALKFDSLIKHRIKFEPESFDDGTEPRRDALTLDGLVLLYLRDKKMSDLDTRKTLCHVKPLLEAVGRVLVSTMTVQDMRRGVSALKATGIKQVTINRRVSIVKAALNWGEDNGVIEHNPVPRFSFPRGDETRIPPPTPAEIERIMMVTPEHVRRVVILGAALGVRIGPSELFALRWENVDTSSGMVRVTAAKKNKKRPWRDLYIRPELRPLLEAWERQDALDRAKHEEHGKSVDGRYEHLIHWRGHQVSSIKTAWWSMLKRAGITRRIRPYDLRHAFATYALDAGADPKAVAEVMGHADMAMVHRHYQHVLERQRRDALEKAPLPGGHSGGLAGDFSGTFDAPDENKIQ